MSGQPSCHVRMLGQMKVGGGGGGGKRRQHRALLCDAAVYILHQVQ